MKIAESATLKRLNTSGLLSLKPIGTFMKRMSKGVKKHLHKSWQHREMGFCGKRTLHTESRIDDRDRNVVDKKLYHCLLCKQSFSLSDIRKHRATVHNSRTFACNQCHKVFSSRLVLKSHVFDSHLVMSFRNAVLHDALKDDVSTRSETEETISLNLKLFLVDFTNELGITLADTSVNCIHSVLDSIFF